MTKDEKMELLKTWERQTRNLIAQWDGFETVTGATAYSPLGEAVWDVWGYYAGSVCRLLECDPSHLPWYCYNNEMGEKELEFERNGETRKICNVDDLAWMIGLDE